MTLFILPLVFWACSKPERKNNHFHERSTVSASTITQDVSIPLTRASFVVFINGMSAKATLDTGLNAPLAISSITLPPALNINSTSTAFVQAFGSQKSMRFTKKPIAIRLASGVSVTSTMTFLDESLPANEVVLGYPVIKALKAIYVLGEDEHLIIPSNTSAEPIAASATTPGEIPRP
jgi:hypothetical protein